MPELTAMTRSPGATVPSTSARLRRAALAERRVLARKRDDLELRSETLRSERERIEIMLIKLERQIALLDGITGGDTAPPPSPASKERGTAQPAGNRGLCGLAIRRLAVGRPGRGRRPRRPDLLGMALMLTRSDLIGHARTRLFVRGARGPESR
jgi:hypothetical protein